MTTPNVAPPATGLLEMEFIRRPGWLWIVVPVLAIGLNAFSGTAYAPHHLYSKIQEVLGPGMGGHHLFAGVALVLLIPVLRSAGVRAAELGLGRGTLRAAVLTTLALWVAAIVLVELLSNTWAGHRPGLHRQWTEMGAIFMAGIFLGFLMSAALEEVVFRAVLFPQAYVRLRERTSRRWVAVGLAALLTQGSFALLHLPARLQGGHYDRLWVAVGDQTALLLGGCLGILVLVATRNLAIMIGFHTLYNAPIPLFAPPPDTPRLGSRVAVLLVGMIALAAWIWYVARRNARDLAVATPVVASPEQVPLGAD